MDCEGDDRLSSLPNDLLLKILSFVGSKDAIKTSVLSSRWRHLWTSIPGLSFSTKDYSTIDKLSNFVKFISRHKEQPQLASFCLYFHRKRGRSRIQRIVNRALSLNVQQLSIICLFENRNFLRKENEIVPFPLSLPGSWTLKQLTLGGCGGPPFHEFVITSTQEFSSLTTLRLHAITLYDDDVFFSLCPNLKDLALFYCKVSGSKAFRICHPRLSNLTLEMGEFSIRTYNVVTPQLKNLSILKFRGEKYQVSAPGLASLHFQGSFPQTFSTDGFLCLEKAHVSFHDCGGYINNLYTMTGLLQQFHNVKHLSLSMEIIELLCTSSMELILYQPSPLCNLESLTLFPRDDTILEQKNARLPPIKVVNYLLNSSPKATLKAGLLEECCVLPFDSSIYAYIK